MQMSLALQQDAHPKSLCDVIADHLTAHVGEWVEGKVLAQIGGYGGWRTRISELRDVRKLPIETLVEQIPGSRRKRSFYKLVEVK